MTELPKQPGEHSEDAPRPEDASTIKDSREMFSGGQKDPMIGLTVGQYTIKRVIGSGGMGTVYEAMQQSPRRTVALKMLKQGIASRSALKRFEYEAQTLGRLRHENIAQIHEAGTWDDGTGARPFFAMEYLAGAKSLTQYALDKKLGTRERLELFLKVCEAVQHGHQKGIIHRDLKPENILVTSSGVPKIIDFGVARSTDSDMAVTTLQTDVGALIGTLQYMSPEQCAADPNDIDTRSDVYALGVILFELLCEDLPYDVTKVALHEAARIVQEEDPTKPSTVDKRLRGDVEIITLKALEKDRDRRYQSAVELEQDIGRYLAGDPITAKAPSAFDYLKRFARKHKAAAISISAIFVVLVAAVIAISVFAAEAQHQRILAVEAKEDAEDKSLQLKSRNVDLAKVQEQDRLATEVMKIMVGSIEQARAAALKEAYYGNIHAARADLQDEDLELANRRLSAALVAKDLKEGEQPPFEWQYLHAQCNDNPMTVVEHGVDPKPGTSAYTKAVGLNHDGTMMASAGSDGYVRIWHVPTGEELTSWQPKTGAPLLVEFSPDGRRLACLADLGWNTIEIWDIETEEIIHQLHGHGWGISDICFSLDENWLASCGNDRTIKIWDLESGTILKNFDAKSPVTTIAISRAKHGLLAAGVGADIHIWNIETGEEYTALHGHQEKVCSLAFEWNDGGMQLVSGSHDRTVRRWTLSAENSKELLRLENCHPDDPLEGTFFTYQRGRGSTQVAGAVHLYHTASGSEMYMPMGPQRFRDYSRFTFSPDGSRLALFSGRHKSIQLWNTGTNGEVNTLKGGIDRVVHNGANNRFAYSPDGSRLAHSGNRTLRVWDTLTGDELMASDTATGHLAGEKFDLMPSPIAFSPDGSILAWTTEDGDVRFCDTATGQEEIFTHGHGQTILGLAFSPDGARLAQAGNGNISIWSVKSGEEIATYGDADRVDRIYSIAFIEQGKAIAAATSAGTIDIWRDGDLVRTLAGHEGHVVFMAYSPEGNRIASLSDDNDIRIWDVKDILNNEHDPEVIASDVPSSKWSTMDFNADGTRLVSDFNINNRVYTFISDTKTGELILSFQGVGNSIMNPAFSPDGKQLIGWESMDDELVVRTFDTRTRDQIALDRRLARHRTVELTPLVESWIEKSDGDSELVIAMLEREVKNRTAEEQVTLRNLVLKKLSEHRQANEAEEPQPAAP